MTVVVPCADAPGPTIVSPTIPLPAPTAQLGSDGRWHLTGNVRDDFICAAPDLEVHRHTQRCPWTTDGHRYQIGGWQGDVDWWWGERFVVDWEFELVGEPVLAEAIPRRQRCNVSGRYAWPVFYDPGSAFGRIRIALIEDLGPWCHLCGRQQDHLVVDHDHTTGLVRGLLCIGCNAWVDRCEHDGPGCAFVQYRGQPPAEHLGLTYPSWRSRQPNSRRRR
ncbi:endonuclease domain-containing protein [Nakamurella lactea]|uniref:endonuclease domain-containing protein n=1 Tax=Nakamurella lactea TaxID=459515 RepID=UPI000A01E13C|nr:endonuclease domain-containing protein [Nakamurella lactea]